MKIKIICDNDKYLNEFKIKLKKELLKDKWENKYKIKFITKQDNNVDVYIIISDNLDYVCNITNNLEIKDNERIIVLTSNLKSANIIGCLNITPYVYYIKTKIEAIVFKIIRVYERNKNNLYIIPVQKKDSKK